MKSLAGFGTEACRRQWRMKVGRALEIARSVHGTRLCEFPGLSPLRGVWGGSPMTSQRKHSLRADCEAACD